MKPDDDLVTVNCTCGNKFKLPFDALFGLQFISCGQCGQSGNFSVTEKEELKCPDKE